jgi:MFS superfamily sulfate permease-like transporter
VAVALRLAQLSPIERTHVSAPNASGSHALNLSPRANLRHDAPAGLVVALVALPLCLGIALASGAPLAAGLVAGIVGGLIVPWFTGSPLSVSGPAAGLTTIVLAAIANLGYEAFLAAVCMAGVIQFVLGMLRGGLVAYYFPSSVVRGLLAAIGVILILKQIPHAIGFDLDPEGEMAFEQLDGRNTFTEIPYALGHLHLGAATIALVGLGVLILLERYPKLRRPWMPGPLAAVVIGLGLNAAFRAFAPELSNEHDLLVSLGDGQLWNSLPFPDLSRIMDPAVVQTGFTLAIVASLETLLCVEAMDRIDPYNRVSKPSKELRAQGIGNLVAGLLGGLPLTAVIVRGSAAVQAGGRTWMTSIVHGLILAVAVVALPTVLEQIPLAALAAVLLHVGYKLAKPADVARMWRRGLDQFIPYAATILAIVFTDLLVGVLVGLAAGIFFVLKANLATPYFMHARDDHSEDGVTHVHIELSENVSFLNKASVNSALDSLPEHSVVVIDGSSATYIDQDVLEIIGAFAAAAHHRGITVHLVDIPEDGQTDKRRSRKLVAPSTLPPDRTGSRWRAVAKVRAGASDAPEAPDSTQD